MSGGILTGGLTLKYASPSITLADTSQAAGAGLFRFIDAGGIVKLVRNTAAAGDFSTSTTPISFAATDVATLAQRPFFGANLAWDFGNLPLTVDASQNITAPANLAGFSDERVKTNWRPLIDDFLERLALVKRGVYDRTDMDLTQVGVSAQSLREVIPEAVVEDNDGRLSVAYGQAALVAVIELASAFVKLRRQLIGSAA
ncbi:MAG: tail fiber domain-containing protein [Pararobbsia sp.]